MKKLSEMTYENVYHAVTTMGDFAEIVGEQTVQLEDGRIIEQYIYNLEHYKPENGLPFVAMKCNLTLI